uniref:Uncharacterized protein n=1 Tax=Oryza barthii TaxID=65489 RepID=A0A0D3EJ06_9ORYZ
MASTPKSLQKFNQLEQYTAREGACLATFGLDIVVQTVSSWRGDFTCSDYRTNVRKSDFLFISFCAREPVGNSLAPAVKMADFGKGGAGFAIYKSRRFRFYGLRREKRRWRGCRQRPGAGGGGGHGDGGSGELR